MPDLKEFEYMIGKRYVDDRGNGNEPCADETGDDVVRHSQLPANCRVVHPDSFVTMDFIADRLNVHVDDECMIANVRYG